MPISLHIDPAEIDALARSVDATEAVVRQATRRALSRTARHVFTRVRRSVRTSANVPGKALKNRLKLQVRHQSGVARIWIGIDTINPVVAGARQTRRGVSSRGRKWDGAFIARGRVFRREGRKRVPLEAPRIEIDREVLRMLRTTEVPTAEAFYFKTLRHELKRRMENLRG